MGGFFGALRDALPDVWSRRRPSGVSTRFLLSAQEAGAIVDHVCAVVNNQWRQCYRQAGMSE
jgi:hypothetical protein